MAEEDDFWVWEDAPLYEPMHDVIQQLVAPSDDKIVKMSDAEKRRVLMAQMAKTICTRGTTFEQFQSWLTQVRDALSKASLTNGVPGWFPLPTMEVYQEARKIGGCEPKQPPVVTTTGMGATTIALIAVGAIGVAGAALYFWRR